MNETAGPQKGGDHHGTDFEITGGFGEIQQRKQRRKYMEMQTIYLMQMKTKKMLK